MCQKQWKHLDPQMMITIDSKNDLSIDQLLSFIIEKLAAIQYLFSNIFLNYK